MLKANHITSKIVERPITLQKKGQLPRHHIAKTLRHLSTFPMPNGKRFGAAYGERAINILAAKGILAENTKSLESLTFDRVISGAKPSLLRDFVSEFNRECEEVKLEFKKNKLFIKGPLPPPPKARFIDEALKITLQEGQDSYIVTTKEGKQIEIEMKKANEKIVTQAVANNPHGLDITDLLEQTGLEEEKLYDLVGVLARRKEITTMPHLKEGNFTIRYITYQQRAGLKSEGKILLGVDDSRFDFTVESEAEFARGTVIPVIAGDNTIYYYYAEAFQEIKAQDEKARSPNLHFAAYLDGKGKENIIYTDVAERWVLEGQVAPAMDSKGQLQVIHLKHANQFREEILAYYVNRIFEHAALKRKPTDEEKDLIETTARLALEHYGTKTIEGRILVLTHCLNVAATVASLGGDPITITAALLHKEKNLAKTLVKLKSKLKTAQVKTAQALKAKLDNIPMLIERFKKIIDQPYWPPRPTGKKKRKSKHHIENHISMILNLTRHPDLRHPEIVGPDHRVLLLAFAAKMQKVLNMTQLPKSQRARENLYDEIRHIFASQAERFFFHELHFKFSNQIFRMRDPEKFREIEAKVRDAIKDPPHKVQQLIERIKKRLRLKAAKLKRYGKAKALGRQKFEQSIYEKNERDKKKDLMRDGELMVSRVPDLLAFFLVTEHRIHELEEAKKLVFDALAKYIFKPVPEQIETHEKTGAHHIGFIDKKDRGVEVQVMSGEELTKYMISDAAHWAYKLIDLTGQDFDIGTIRRYAHRITSEFENDFYVVTEPLQNLVFINYYDEQGETRIRRLRRGAIPVDLAAARSINTLNENYAGAEVAELGRDDEGKPVIGNWRKVRENYQFRDGDLVRFTKGKKAKLGSPTGRNIPISACTNIRAKLLLLLWDAKEFKEKAKEGKALVEEWKLYKSKEIQVIAQDSGFANTTEFYAALATPELQSWIQKDAAERISNKIGPEGLENAIEKAIKSMKKD